MNRRRVKRLLARQLREVLRGDEWMRSRLRGSPRNRERDARSTLAFTLMTGGDALAGAVTVTET